MRKALILLVAFAVLGGAAFADGKFTAWNQGNLFLFGQLGARAGTPATTFAGWGPSWDKPNTGVDQEWSFGWDGTNIGFSGTFEFGNMSLGQPAGATNWFGTYFKFADIVKLTIGAPRIVYRQYDYIEGATATSRFVNGEYSAAIEVMPIKGLTVGFVQYIANAAGTELTTHDSPNAWEYISTAIPGDYFSHMGLGVLYSMEGFGTFMAQYKSSDKALGVGATVTSIKDVGISLSTSFGFPTTTTTTISAILGLQAVMAPFTVAATAGLYVPNATTSAFAIEAKVEYAMGMYAFGILGGYDDGKGVGLFNQQCATWDGPEVYPYVKANFDGGYVQLGVVYAGGANNHSSLIAIPIVYSWSF